MKTKLRFLQLVVLTVTLVAFAPVGVLVGCKSANQTAYRVTGSVVVSVDVAMRAWGKYVSEKHPSIEAEQKVKLAFDRYKKSAILVTDAGKVLAQLEAAKADPTNAKSNLDIALAGASASLQDLIQLVQSFGIKLN